MRTAKMKKILAILFALLLPSLVLAQAGTISGLIKSIVDILGLLVPLIFALALLYFFWGLGQFILNAGSEDGREKGKHVMLWGVIALFVMVSIWGIVGILDDTFFRTSAGPASDTRPFGGL